MLFGAWGKSTGARLGIWKGSCSLPKSKQGSCAKDWQRPSAQSCQSFDLVQRWLAVLAEVQSEDFSTQKQLGLEAKLVRHRRVYNTELAMPRPLDNGIVID